MVAPVPFDEIWKRERPPGHFKTTIPAEVLARFQERQVKRVLDLGSGDGANAILLASNGFEVHALDIAVSGIENTLRLAKEQQCTVVALCADMYGPLPYPAGYFDAVYSYQALYHNALPAIIKLLNEVYRVLAPNGFFSAKLADKATFVVNHVRDDIYVAPDSKTHFRFYDEQTYEPTEGDEKGLLHYAFYRAQFAQLLQAIGFHIISDHKEGWHFRVEAQKR